MSKIKTTHVGSLPRSNELSELLFKKDQKEQIDFNQFNKVVQKDVNKIVKKQIEVGIDCISDGEMSRLVMLLMLRIELMDFLERVREKHQKI